MRRWVTLPAELDQLDRTRPVSVDPESLSRFLHSVEARLAALETRSAQHERDLLPLQTFGAPTTPRIEFDRARFAEELQANRETIAGIVHEQARRSLTYRRELLEDR